ncbi:hypothetical protein C0J52_26543 [Blattella germanica]|nr:hypothetical protein C0J52_26543 [Blattella germanica]
MSNAPKKIGHRKRKSCDEAKMKEASHHICLRRKNGIFNGCQIFGVPTREGSNQRKGYQKQVKSTSTTVVEDTTGSEEEQMSIHDDSMMRNTKLAMKKFQNRVILNEFSAKQIFRRRTR